MIPAMSDSTWHFFVSWPLVLVAFLVTSLVFPRLTANHPLATAIVIIILVTIAKGLVFGRCRECGSINLIRFFDDGN